MPSRRTVVTLEFRYCLVGAPCGGASLGIVGAGSGCCDVALEVASLPLRDGVPVLAGAGLAAFVAPGAIAGDWSFISLNDDKAWQYIDLQLVYQASCRSL